MATIAKQEKETLDNSINLVSEGVYETDNSRVKSTFLQANNEVIFEKNGRKISWTPQNMRYVDEVGEEDLIFTVQEVPLEVKSNYARYNRSMPDVDDWFIQDNDRLKHQILIQGFQPDPIPWLIGNIDFCIGGKMSFDADLKIVADGLEQVNPFVTEGSIQLYDGDTLIFELPQVIAFDSNLDRAMTFGKYRVYFNDQAEMMFDFIIDYEWMTAQERVYPIVIDPTVVASSGYSTAGNGGRKGVELNNGWLVTNVFDPSNEKSIFFVSKDKGSTWTQLCFAYASSLKGGGSIVAKGNRVYHLVTIGSQANYLISFDATIVSNTDLSSTKSIVDSGQIEFSDNNSMVINSSGTELHAVWSSKNNIYPFCFNLRYCKGTINADGSVSWGTITQISNLDASGVDWINPCIVLNKNGNPIILFHAIGSTAVKRIGSYRFNGTSWSVVSDVYSPGSVYYEQSYSTAVTDKNGIIHVVWHGFDETDQTFKNIRYSKSADTGATWSVPVKLTSGNTIHRQNPSIACDKNNKLYITYEDNGTLKRIESTDSGASWSTPATLATGTNPAMFTSLTSSLVNWVYMSGSTVQYDKIELNQPPAAPTLTTKSNFDATVTTDFFWTHNDPDPSDTQTAYQLQIVDASTNSTVFDSGKVASTTSKRILSPNTLVNGKQYQWRVKTWDNANYEGSYSTYSTFYTNAKPSVAIVVPTTNAILNGSSLTVEWSFSSPSNESQGAFQIELLSSADTVLWTSGKVIDSRSRLRTIDYMLVNNSSYKVRITVWDGKDIISESMTTPFTVAYTPPLMPIVVASTEEGKIHLSITNGESINNPSVTTNEVYRRDFDWVRIGIVGPNTTFTDNTVGHNVNYEYKVRSIAGNGASIESEFVNAITTISNAVLSKLSDPSKQVKLIFNPNRSESRERQRSLNQFAGRKDPLPEYGEHRSLNLDTSYSIMERSELDSLIEFADSGENLLYRDSRGRREFVSISSISVSDKMPNYYEVSIPMTRISYTEEV